jgi:hypothetical protein
MKTVDLYLVNLFYVLVISDNGDLTLVNGRLGVFNGLDCNRLPSLWRSRTPPTRFKEFYILRNEYIYLFIND